MARNAQIKLSDVATSRVNNLNFIRFIAALMVIVFTATQWFWAVMPAAIC